MLHRHRFLVDGRIPVLKVHREPRPAAAVVVLHGLGASVDVQLRELESLAEHGLTALGVDAPHHGARRDGWLDEIGPMSPPGSHVMFLRLLLEALPEVSRTLDHLAGEGHGPFGVLGISMGAYLALAAAAADPRLAATVSILGSPSWAPREGPVTDEMRALMSRAPAHRPPDCARHPLLMMNAGRDAVVPPGLPGGPRDFVRVLEERYPSLAAHVTYVEYAESGHLMREEDWQDLWRRALGYLHAHLGV